MTQQVRNLRAFIGSYLKSDAGQAALARKDIRVKDKETGKWKHISRSNQMAVAFQTAIA